MPEAQAQTRWRAWRDAVFTTADRAGELLERLEELREEAAEALERLEDLIGEAWVVRGEAPLTGAWGSLVKSACTAWASLIEGFRLGCDPEVKAVCSAFLRGSELPDCPTY